MKQFLYGIDFGTTNSAIVIYDEEAGQIFDKIIIPSLIYFYANPEKGSDKTYVVGEEAVAAYLSDGMQGRFIKSVKQILSRSSFSETRIQGKKYTASDLVAVILKELKHRADILTGQDGLKAVIGRPVFFDDDDVQKDTLAQTRLQKAADMAGFTQVRFQYEPIGAAFAYERNLQNKENVLVADLGGGTTDFTYLTLDPEKTGSKDRKSDMMASGGIYIGGDSFDSAFMWEKGTPYFGRDVQYKAGADKYLTVPKSLFANICTWEKMNFLNGQRVKKEIDDYYYFSGKDRTFKNLITMVENNLGYAVFQSIEQTKIALSGTDVTTFSYQHEDINISEEVSLPAYEQIINKDVTRIADYLQRFLTENNIDPSAIDTIFLTGGTSMVRGIKRLFQSQFPHVNLRSGDNFNSVAIGLAYSGYLFEN